MKKAIEIIFLIAVIVGGYLLIKNHYSNLAGEKSSPTSAPESMSETENVTGEKNSATIQNAEIKNVVLVTLDTVRADHYGFMNYPRNTTPFIDKLANEGTVFKNAYTVVSETGPSVSSMFTSLYPFEHHVINNNIKLDGFRTLPEYLKEQSYTTGSFVSTVFFNTINNKFDHFDFEGDPTLGPELVARKRAGDKTISRAKEWLGQVPPNEKAFLWVHLFDAHLPSNNDINYIENEGDRLNGDSLVNF